MMLHKASNFVHPEPIEGYSRSNPVRPELVEGCNISYLKS